MQTIAFDGLVAIAVFAFAILLAVGFRSLMSWKQQQNSPPPTQHWTYMPGGEDNRSTADLASSRYDYPQEDFTRLASSLRTDEAILIVKRGPRERLRFTLDQERTIVGRGPESDVFLDDISVSRRHALIYRQAGKFHIGDLGSINGIYINQKRVPNEQPLSSEDEIQIGKFRLIFLQGRRRPTVP